MSISSHRVDRQDRMTVQMTLLFPDPHRFKTYEDNRRKYIVNIDSTEVHRQDKKGEVSLKVKLRSLIVIKKMFGEKKTDSVLTYRVGENFCILKIGTSTLRISLKFEGDNTFEVLDSSSKIASERLLEVVKDSE